MTDAFRNRFTPEDLKKIQPKFNARLLEKNPTLAHDIRHEVPFENLVQWHDVDLEANYGSIDRKSINLINSLLGLL
jgi:hypothetical protein